jgi:hypothetical protein
MGLRLGAPCTNACLSYNCGKRSTTKHLAAQRSPAQSGLQPLLSISDEAFEIAYWTSQRGEDDQSVARLRCLGRTCMPVQPARWSDVACPAAEAIKLAPRPNYAKGNMHEVL